MQTIVTRRKKLDDRYFFLSLFFEEKKSVGVGGDALEDGFSMQQLLKWGREKDASRGAIRF